MQDLRKLFISGYKGLDDVTLELDTGRLFLHGPNGSGKSAILEAITILMLGHLPAAGKRLSTLEPRLSAPGCILRLEGDSTWELSWQNQKGWTWRHNGQKVRSSLARELLAREHGSAISTVELGRLLEGSPRAITERLADMVLSRADIKAAEAFDALPLEGADKATLAGRLSPTHPMTPGSMGSARMKEEIHAEERARHQRKISAERHLEGLRFQRSWEPGELDKKKAAVRELGDAINDASRAQDERKARSGSNQAHRVLCASRVLTTSLRSARNFSTARWRALRTPSRPTVRRIARGQQSRRSPTEARSGPRCSRARSREDRQVQ